MLLCGGGLPRENACQCLRRILHGRLSATLEAQTYSGQLNPKVSELNIPNAGAKSVLKEVQPSTLEVGGKPEVDGEPRDAYGFDFEAEMA